MQGLFVKQSPKNYLQFFETSDYNSVLPRYNNHEKARQDQDVNKPAVLPDYLGHFVRR